MRYIWDREKRAFVPAHKYRRKRGSRPINIMRDQEGFVSPIDRSWVEGRAQVREHERRHNVNQIGNDIQPPS